MQSIYIPSRVQDWYREDRTWAKDRRYSLLLRILRTKNTEIRTKFTWKHRVLHGTRRKSGRNIKTRCVGSTSNLLFRKDSISIRRDRTLSFFTTHTQLFVIPKCAGMCWIARVVMCTQITAFRSRQSVKSRSLSVSSEKHKWSTLFHIDSTGQSHVAPSRNEVILWKDIWIWHGRGQPRTCVPKKRHQDTVCRFTTSSEERIYVLSNTVERHHLLRHTSSFFYSESYQDGNWRSHIRESLCVTPASSEDFF